MARELTPQQLDYYTDLLAAGTDRFEAREIARAYGGPPPEVCPKCGTVLKESKGYVGELVLYCPNRDCDQGIVWEDSAGAIRRVI